MDFCIAYGFDKPGTVFKSMLKCFYKMTAGGSAPPR